MMLRRRRQSHQVAAQLPDLADVVIVGVRAGLSLRAALTAAIADAPLALSDAFAEVDHRLSRGDTIADALAPLGAQLGPEAAVFADTLATTDRYGLPLDVTLQRLALDSRDARRRLAERYARTLPVRLSFPLVICTLPSFVLCAIVPALLGTLSDLRGLTP